MPELFLPAVAKSRRANPRVVVGMQAVAVAVITIAVVEMAVVAVATVVAIAARHSVHVVIFVVVATSLDGQLFQIGIVDGEGGIVSVKHCKKETFSFTL